MLTLRDIPSGKSRFCERTLPFWRILCEVDEVEQEIAFAGWPFPTNPKALGHDDVSHDGGTVIDFVAIPVKSMWELQPSMVRSEYG